MSVSHTLRCFAGPIQIGNYSAMMEYHRYDFSDGSVLTSCMVADRSTSYTNTFMYTAGQNGAATGACMLVYDIDSTVSFGFWSFSGTAQGPAATAAYSDSGSAYNGTRVTITCD
jgi:hypothetical protein